MANVTDDFDQNEGPSTSSMNVNDSGSIDQEGQPDSFPHGSLKHAVERSTTPSMNTPRTEIDTVSASSKKKRTLAAIVSSPGSRRSLRSSKSWKSLRSSDEFKVIPEFGQSACAHEEVLEDILEQQQASDAALGFSSASAASTARFVSGSSSVKTSHRSE